MKIKQLTGLRGVAAFCVMLGHLPHAPSEGIIGQIFAYAVLNLALPNLGVVVFYSLSSFLLTYSALQERERTGTVSIVSFLLRRVIRIWPLYFVAVFVAAIVFRNYDWLAAEAGYVFTFLSNWSWAVVGLHGHVSLQPSPVTLLWSISVEEQFYLLFPVLVFALSAASTRYVAVVIGALFAGGYIFRIAFSIMSAGVTPAPGAGGMYFATFAYLDTFAAGSVAAIIYYHRDNNELCGKACKSLAGAVPAVVVGLIAISSLWARNIWAPYNAMTVISFGLVGVGGATLVLSIAVAGQSRIVSFLKSWPIDFLGTVSFSFYVWHLYAVTLSVHMSTTFPSRFLITFCLAVAFAIASYFLIERPALRIKDRIRTGPG